MCDICTGVIFYYIFCKNLYSILCGHYPFFFSFSFLIKQTVVLKIRQSLVKGSFYIEIQSMVSNNGLKEALSLTNSGLKNGAVFVEKSIYIEI